MQTPHSRFARAAAMTTLLALTAAACGDDDGAAVRDEGSVEVIDGGDASASASGSASASASAPAEGTTAAPETSSSGDAGYTYGSNVNAQRLVSADVCDIAEALDAEPIDFATAAELYRGGKYSVNSDGTLRTLGGFAADAEREHGLDEFYGTPTPLDDFVSAALAGTGIFEGASEAARAQGVEKGVQNQVMVAWMLHELNSAIAKAEAGELDAAEGAPHNWDEAWAFYAGAEPGCAPYATADKRGADFGTVGEDGTTSLANAGIVQAMTEGHAALVEGDVAAASAAADEVVRNLVITYSQAVIKYAGAVPEDVTAGDLDSAEVHRAEGYAFWRVLAPLAVPAGADGDAIEAVLALDGELGAQGDSDDVRAALQPALDVLGISAEDIGQLG